MTAESHNSIFADGFLKAIKEIDETIFYADELFYQYIRSKAAGRSDEVPEYNEIRNSFYCRYRAAET